MKWQPKLVCFIAFLFALTLSIPLVNSQNLFEVEITWTISGRDQETHSVEFDGQSFELSNHEPQTLAHKMKGGCMSAIGWSHCGWGFLNRSLLVDVKDIRISQLNTLDQTGNIRILGFCRRRTARVEIQLD